jgi:hypothetical protein
MLTKVEERLRRIKVRQAGGAERGKIEVTIKAAVLIRTETITIQESTLYKQLSECEKFIKWQGWAVSDLCRSTGNNHVLQLMIARVYSGYHRARKQTSKTVHAWAVAYSAHGKIAMKIITAKSKRCIRVLKVSVQLSALVPLR